MLRLLTNQATMSANGEPPLTNQQAWRTFDQLIADDRIALMEIEPPDLAMRWREYSDRPRASVKLWMDAYLAAFARAAGLTLVTLDRAFRQFPDLDVLILDES